MAVVAGQDPNVIPPSVARNAARSEALIAEQLARKNAQAPPASVEPPTLPTPPAPDPAPEVTPQSNAQSNAQNNTPTPDPFEHQYNSMKGRFERAENEKRQMSAQLAEMQRLLATLQASPSQAPARSDVSFGRLITPTEETEYGTEMLDVVGRRAKEIVTPEVASLKAEIEELKNRIGGVTNVVTMDARQRMFQDLDGALPNWRAQNVDPNFIAWLGLPDPYSGVIRHTLLGQAFAGNQTSRVLSFFKGFVADEAATRPAGQREQPSGTRTPELSLDALAAPGRARQPGSAPLPAEKPTFTRAQVAAFYRAVNSGQYAGRDNDKTALEKAIFEAGRDGRIT